MKLKELTIAFAISSLLMIAGCSGNSQSYLIVARRKV